MMLVVMGWKKRVLPAIFGDAGSLHMEKGFREDGSLWCVLFERGVGGTCDGNVVPRDLSF